MAPSRGSTYSCSSATPSGPKSSVAARASRSAGVSKRSISAPEPPTFGLTSAGKADLTSNLPQRGDTVDDDGARVPHAESLEQLGLERFSISRSAMPRRG